MLVNPACLFQLCLGARFGYPAVLQHDYLVHAVHRSHAVRDYQRREYRVSRSSERHHRSHHVLRVAEHRKRVPFLLVHNKTSSYLSKLDLANLKAGQYTVKQIMEAMLVPSGNDAAYALAYHIAKNELGEGYTVTEYIDYFMTELREYLIEEGYSKTNLYNDPSGASMQADTHLDDINHVALKLLNYDFVRECIGESSFSIQTPQGEFTWKNTNEFLDKNSPYYNTNVKGMKTGTMASSYSIVVLYEKDEKKYLITCLAALSNEGRYKAVQSAINTIIK